MNELIRKARHGATLSPAETRQLAAICEQLATALEAYVDADECVNTPDAPDFRPGPHKVCHFCDGMAALDRAGCLDRLAT